jgi:hypothetical protein
MNSQLAMLTREPAKRIKPPVTGVVGASIASYLQAEVVASAGNGDPISFAQIPVLAAKEHGVVNPFVYRERRFPIQRKLAIGVVDDPFESEANSIAEQVITVSKRVDPIRETGQAGIRRKCACEGSDVECAECRKEREKIIQGKAADTTTSIEAPPIVHQVLSSPGRPLDPATRGFFEPRFGFDFSQVRVHTGKKAEESAAAVNAVAYTVGSNVVFGTGRYLPSTSEGKRLMAHELTHVVQQRGLAPADIRISDPNDRSEQEAAVIAENTGIVARQAVTAKGGLLLQRQQPTPAPGATPPSPAPPPPDVFATLASQIRATPAYKALDAERKKLTDQIFVEIHKRPPADQLHFLGKLKLLFDTPVNPPDVIAAHTEAGTAAAATAEKARLAKPAEAKRKTLEEQASADPKRTWTPIKGKFGDGTYYVDRTSPTNIVVKADILLTPKGTGTKKDVDAIKGMEDAIEKAASNKGYIVDIRFVDTAGPDTFKVDVDPSKWEVATNWSGGDPLGFAHELHHMFAFELDRYNYIEAHADNKDMQVPDRLYWFMAELEKPADYNDPTSIMNAAAHPNDDDACRVAGLDVKTCVPARAAARAAGTL